MMKLPKFLNLFKRKIKEVPEEKMSLEIAILMCEVMTPGYIENWSVATESMMGVLQNTIRHGVRLGYDIEIIVGGESYVINMTNMRRIRLINSTVKVSDKHSIRNTGLEISLKDTGSDNTNLTLIVNSTSFVGLYLINGKEKVNLTTTIPDCKAFEPISSIYRSIHKEDKDKNKGDKSKVVQLNLPPRRK